MNNKLNWRSWCRLCATMQAENNIRVQFKDEPTDDQEDETTFLKNLSTAEAIERYFYVNFRENANAEELPNTLCMDCVSLINSLEKFVERVSRVQQMFDSLNWTTESIDLDAVRLNFGITDGDHFVLTKQLTPEVHYFGSEQQADFLQVDSLKNLDTEDPLHILSQIKKEDQLDDAFPIEYEMETKDIDDLPKNDVKSQLDFWDNSKSMKKSKKMAKSKNNDTDADGLHTCTECHKKYKYLHQHMKRAHSIILPAVEYPCTECDLVFINISRLKEHKKVHTPVELRRNIPCKYCDKKFISNFKANTHMRQIHMNERLYMCAECGMDLCSSVSLRIHMLMHSGFNPFKCEVCGKGFKEKNKLKLHMDVHSDTNFTCPHCGREFKTRILLRHHLPSHCDVKRYKCNLCESSFKRAKTLKNHLIMHTGLKMFSCNFCDRTFSTGSSCRLHKRTLHPEELAAYEAAGNAPPVHNIPTLATLRTMKKPLKP